LTLIHECLALLAGLSFISRLIFKIEIISNKKSSHKELYQNNILFIAV